MGCTHTVHSSCSLVDNPMGDEMATAMNPLPSLIRASSMDAGNFSMRDGGRSKWSDDDYNAACETFNRLVASCYGEGPDGCIKFAVAEHLERAGKLRLTMKHKEFFATVEAACAA